MCVLRSLLTSICLGVNKFIKLLHKYEKKIKKIDAKEKFNYIVLKLLEKKCCIVSYLFVVF